VTSNEKVLNQILLIVLENAISILVERKTDNPVIHIAINKNDKHTNIIITDNGGGILESDINKVFTMHYSKREDKGLGIGLALAKRLIKDKLNGKIELQNTENGASFKLII
jgi:C4-dicarboxylate-specific signal transduction histidine kinase